MPGLAQRFEHFLFAPVNGQVARWFRIALTVMLLATFRPRGSELAREYAGIAWLTPLYDKYFLTLPYQLWLVALLVLFACGWRTQIVGFLLVIFLAPLDLMANSQQSRQVMLFALLAFSCFPSDLTRPMPMWPIRLMQIQLTLVYGINALVKTSPHFLSGEAFIGMAHTLPNFQIKFVDGAWQLWFLALPVGLLAIATVFTEYFLALGFWFSRTRVATAILGVGFHLALKFVIKIGMLDWVSMFLYLAFLLPFEEKNAEVSLARKEVSTME